MPEPAQQQSGVVPPPGADMPGDRLFHRAGQACLDRGEDQHRRGAGLDQINGEFAPLGHLPESLTRLTGRAPDDRLGLQNHDRRASLSELPGAEHLAAAAPPGRCAADVKAGAGRRADGLADGMAQPKTHRIGREFRCLRGFRNIKRVRGVMAAEIKPPGGRDRKAYAGGSRGGDRRRVGIE